LLALEFITDAVGHGRILFGQAAGEEATWHSVASAIVKLSGGRHQSDSCKRLESSLTRRSWRPPAKLVSRKACTQAFAMSLPIKRAPRPSTLASLCSRESCADRGSSTRA